MKREFSLIGVGMVVGLGRRRVVVGGWVVVGGRVVGGNVGTSTGIWGRS